MTTIDRVRIEWSMPAGGLGLTTLYGVDGVDLVNDFTAFVNAVKPRIPIGVTLSSPGDGDQIDDVTGELVGSWSGSTGFSIAGTGTGSWAAGVGLFVRWTTAGIFRGRRVKGRTFMCPLNSFSFDTVGTLDSNARTEFQTAAANLISSHPGNLLVWSRPVDATPGESNAVVGSSVDDRVTSLRSRRY